MKDRDAAAKYQLFVSVIIPCRNEEDYIGACLQSIIQNDFPKDRLEVLVVDGMSEDGTKKIVQEFMNLYSFISLHENEQRITPTALNIGIRKAKGEIIMRMDAHCSYPNNYISKLVHWVGVSGADNVGSILTTTPADDSSKSMAIASALSHPFGVGNAYFRIGLKQPKWVDTVPYGCYRREVFERIGLFDEEMIRNQDDELNHRLIKNGGRILLVPDVTFQYFARKSIFQLWRMYFQYGYFKPISARKVGMIRTFRQIIPSISILSLFASGFGSIFFPSILPFFLGILCLYILANFVFSFVGGFKTGLKCVFWLMAAFATLHFAYGIGYLKGSIDCCILKNRGNVSSLPISR